MNNLNLRKLVEACPGAFADFFDIRGTLSTEEIISEVFTKATFPLIEQLVGMRSEDFARVLRVYDDRYGPTHHKNRVLYRLGFPERFMRPGSCPLPVTEKPKLNTSIPLPLESAIQPKSWPKGDLDEGDFSFDELFE